MSAFGSDFLQVLEESRHRLATPSDPLSPGPGIREWLLKGGTYTVAKSTSSALQVTCLDNSWMPANGADAARFLWAARDSVVPRSAPTYDPRSTAWAFVSLYYSGFFMANALLRMFGHGAMFLNQGDRTLLSVAPGVTSKLDRGTYQVEISLGSKSTITLSKIKGSGFHEAFWRFFDISLQSISNNIASGNEYFRAFSPIVRASAASETDELRSLFGTPAGSSYGIGWMSTLRNDVNYRFDRNVWAPRFQKGGVAIDRLRDDVIGIIRDPRRTLGAKLKLDQDLRQLLERVCFVYRGISSVCHFLPPI